MLINTEKQFNTFVAEFEMRMSTLGLPLHEYQALIALRIPEFRQAILEKIAEGFYLINVTRVYYSQVVSVLEVLARFAIGQGELQKRCAVLVTFKSTDFSLVSIAKDYEDLEIDAPAGITLLPVAMAAPSKNEAVGRATDPALLGLVDARRQQYVNNLMLTSGKEPGLLDSTNCPTGRQSPTFTNQNSEYTTALPGGGTTPDTKIDEKTDDNQDVSTDTNDDQNLVY